ncbi:MAG: hypothetical protein H6562_08560 [Lewinellaceae bacterium]|nr:hypothetical protein [Lewinella sp.]MCB9278950.1 hypothetical protein [Lewinellaceae bacterium]
MKKLFLLPALVFCALMFTPETGDAQAYLPTRLFRHGQADAWFGIGVLPTYLKDQTRMSFLPVSAGADWMAGNLWSLGFSVGYSNYQMNKPPLPNENARRYRNTSILGMARVAAHFTKTDNLDFYGGFQLGAQATMIHSLSGEFGAYEDLHGIRPGKVRLQYGAFLGFKFAVSHKTSIFGELGTGVSLAQVGAAIRIR